jgi:hypothetical protein
MPKIMQEGRRRARTDPAAVGHASIATSERYLGSQQNLEHAPNDRLPLTFL